MWLGFGNCFEAPFFYSVYGNPIRTDVLIASLAESLDSPSTDIHHHCARQRQGQKSWGE
jgi:hypothetical protein